MVKVKLLSIVLAVSILLGCSSINSLLDSTNTIGGVVESISIEKYFNKYKVEIKFIEQVEKRVFYTDTRFDIDDYIGKTAIVKYEIMSSHPSGICWKLVSIGVL